MPNHGRGAARMCLALGVVALGASSSANAQEKGRQASRIEYEGWRQYMVHCARCHGDDAVGGIVAPDLRGSVAKGRVDESSFHAVVADGRRDKGMPGFKGTLADDQIKKIFAYVKARGKGEIPAGRPG